MFNHCGLASRQGAGRREATPRRGDGRPRGALRGGGRQGKAVAEPTRCAARQAAGMGGGRQARGGGGRPAG